MLPVHFQQALSLGIPGDMRQHTQKEKTKVRKSGQSGLRKVKELGQKAKILTALFFFDPIAGDFSVGGHIPDGETIPDFNLLFQNYIREPQAYPRRQRRSTRNTRRQQSELPHSNQTTVREDTAEVGQTSPTGSSPTESHQLGSAPDTIDESNPPNMRKEEELFLLDETNGDYAENGLGSLEEEMPVDPFGTSNSGAEIDQHDPFQADDTINVQYLNEDICMEAFLWDDEPIEGSPKAMVPAPEPSKTTRARNLVRFLDRCLARLTLE
ncbi:hypothetical protein B0J13DRAFT_569299 [Dactylonectria estremocensis]|uniref:Uncharacterized protein n=1 Tax=Dactylonectria estremocensis TaxID=1079267 RepID=A0A9P9DI00_9HYPO|nr:hypothetical protein B0J13DRAFT_569299 [Dactylonectria estremocensis]